MSMEEKPNTSCLALGSYMAQIRKQSMGKPALGQWIAIFFIQGYQGLVVDIALLVTHSKSNNIQQQPLCFLNNSIGKRLWVFFILN